MGEEEEPEEEDLGSISAVTAAKAMLRYVQTFSGVDLVDNYSLDKKELKAYHIHVTLDDM